MSDDLPGDIDSLTTLTVEQALRLSRRPDGLSLNGLTAVSDAVAEALSQHLGAWLELNGLTTVSDRAAAALARHKGELHMDSLVKLTSHQLAGKLAAFATFENLTEISAEAARALAEAEDPYFDFNNLQGLSADAAAELARIQGSLSFNGIRNLSEDVAAALAPHEGELNLAGLRSLSEGVARALAQHKGPLYLGELTELSAEAASVLCALKYELALNGLVSLSGEVAESLCRHGKDLYLSGIATLSVSAAKAISGHKEAIYFDGLTTLSAAAAKAISPHEGLLSLASMASVSDDAIRELAKHKGGLSLGGLSHLTDAAAQSLSRFTGWVLLLNGLQSLSPRDAAMLARHRAHYPYTGGLGLRGLKTISAEVAAALARFEGRLFLDGLEELSDDAAAHLATHAGLLSMASLTTLSDRAAEWLGTKAQIEVNDSKWPESAAACFHDSRDRAAAESERHGARPRKPILDNQTVVAVDEASLTSTLVLRDLIAAAPSALSPVGQYSVLLSGGHSLSREEFLRDSDIPRKLRSDVQFAVGDYLASLLVPNAPHFASGNDTPDDSDATRIGLDLIGGPGAVFLDAVSPGILQQLYAAALPAAFGDMKTMETRVDPLVRSGREISADKFAVPRGLCEWVRRTWASRFQPESVRIEPYKINLYAPGDRFVMHRDTPEKDLVGTFLLALSGWGPPCSGGGLVVHDEIGEFRWDGVRGWAAFLPYLPHEVEPVTVGARVTVAFKVFATGEVAGDRRSPFDEASLDEAANRISLCRNTLGQVGVLLKYSYSLNGTALCGSDRFIYRALQRLGTVESVPVAVHVQAEADDSSTRQWRATANVYELTNENLARIARHTGLSLEANTGDTNRIPFIPASGGHVIYSEGSNPIEHAGNYAEPANIETLYVHRALIVREPVGHVASPHRCAAADLAKVDLSSRDLQVADLQSANLAGASLARANLKQAFIANADLSNANLRGADLSGADLACADLTNAQLSGACLRDASLQDACLDGVRWDAETIWPDGFDPSKHGAPPMRAKPRKAKQDDEGDAADYGCPPL